MSASIAIHVGLIKDEGYLVRYELDGGTNNAANPNAIGRNAAPAALAAPTRVGATFDGWYDDAGFSQKIEYVDPMRIAQKLAGGSGPYVLYAKWTATEYDITYELDGGTNHPDTPDKYNLLDGASLREPEKTGYRFMGWYFEGSSPSADVDKAKPVSSLPLLDKTGDWVAAGVTLRAKWEAIEYPITYHTPFAAGKGNNPDTYTVEDTVTLNNADYTGRLINFDGWYTDAEYTNGITQITAGTTGPLSLYAKPDIYLTMLSFHTLGGVYSGQNPMMVNTTGTGGIQLGDASRQGFDFKTWCEQAKTVDGELVADDSDPDKTHNANTPYNPPAIYNALYAAWTPAAGQVELHWIDPLDGEEVYLNHGVKGQTIADPGIAPDHYGYAFDGKWYKDEALTRQWDFSSDTVPTNLTDGLTLYAGLREMYYDVSFEPNGGTAIPAQQVQEGKTAAKPADPVLQNQVFLGWCEDDALSIPYDFSGEVQSNLTLYAKWRSRGPVKPAPGDSKVIGIEDGKEYKHGGRIDFTAVGAGMDNDHPIEGDERYVPQSWSVNPSGTWSGPPYTASFETKDMATGAHTLSVTFALKRYESGAWKDTNDTVQAQVTFTLAEDAPEPTPTPTPGSEPTPTPTGGATTAPGPTPAAPAPTSGVSGGGGAKTGDDTNISLFIVLVLAAVVAIIGVVVYRRRKAGR